MSTLLKVILVSCISFYGYSAQAITQENVPVIFVGSQTVGTAATMVYISLGANNPNNCAASGVFFIDEAMRKDALVIALAAKAFNRVVRLDFTGGGGATCWGTGIFSQ